MSGSASRAYEHIREGILTGRYPSGSRLPEDIVARELGLSRTPVRDAMRRLEAEQLLTMAPYLGARVASWTESDLGEIAHLRTMLESYAAELAATKRTSEDLAIMKEACATMEAEAERERRNFDIISKANLSLHRQVALAAQNTRLLASMEPLWHLPIVIRKFALFPRERMHHSIIHHREIVSAIESRDREWAGTIMRAHILASRSFDAALVETDAEAAGEIEGAAGETAATGERGD